MRSSSASASTASRSSASTKTAVIAAPVAGPVRRQVGIPVGVEPRSTTRPAERAAEQLADHRRLRIGPTAQDRRGRVDARGPDPAPRVAVVIEHEGAVEDLEPDRRGSRVAVTRPRLQVPERRARRTPAGPC